jgi:hypothetical protein
MHVMCVCDAGGGGPVSRISKFPRLRVFQAKLRSFRHAQQSVLLDKSIPYVFSNETLALIHLLLEFSFSRVESFIIKTASLVSSFGCGLDCF